MTLAGNHPAIPKDLFVFIDGGRQIQADIVVVGEQIDVIDNALLYCVSTSDSEDVRKRMADAFRADAIFEISDLQAFHEIVARDPALHSFETRCGRVEYRPRAIANDAERFLPVDPFEKRPDFAWQCEFRMLWKGPSLIQPVQLEIPELVPFLRRLL